MKIFKASWGPLVYWISFLMLVILFLIEVLFKWIGMSLSGSFEFVFYLIPIVILTISYITRVKAFSFNVDNGELIIFRGFYQKKINISDIVSLEKPYISMWKLKKRIGNGGLFGFTGSFSYPKIGKFKSFVTNWEHAILIRTEKQNYIISPDEEEAFMDVLSNYLEQKKGAQ